MIFSCSKKQESNNQYGKIIFKKNTLDSTSIFPKRKIALDSIKSKLIFKPSKSYIETKSNISIIKSEYLKILTSINDSTRKFKFLDSISSIFSEKLLNEIIPHWYGTPWSFSGYTSIPNNGKTGCSYFVSTTLKDMDLNIDRYKLAQQTPENEANSIAILPKNIQKFELQNPYEEIKLMLQKIETGFYFVGLSNHVGYLYISSSGKYFIHSNYIDGYVMVENAEYSNAFISSIYFISKISGNREFINKWITNEEFQISKKINSE